MRRPLAALSLAAALAACAGRVVPTPEALAGLPDQADRPLEAWLSQTRVSDLAFTVNQPAYIAIFFIAPGHGVSMLYPSYRDEVGRTDVGYTIPGYRYDPGQWYFLRSSFDWSPISQATPSYLLLVASKAPLNVAEYERYPGLIRRSLGLATFASYDAYTVMDELTQRIVPVQPDEDWTTDLVVLWPQAPYATYASLESASRRFVRCTNGRILMVPWDYPYGGCPFFSTYLPNPQGPGLPPDTAAAGEKPEQPADGRPGAEPESPHPKKGTPRRERGEPSASDRAPTHVVRSVPVTVPVTVGRRERQAYGESGSEYERGLRQPGFASGGVREVPPAAVWSHPADRVGGSRTHGASGAASGAGRGASAPAPRHEPRGERPAPVRSERAEPRERPVERPSPPPRPSERPSAERPAPSSEKPR